MMCPAAFNGIRLPIRAFAREQGATIRRHHPRRPSTPELAYSHSQFAALCMPMSSGVGGDVCTGTIEGCSKGLPMR